MESNQPWGFFDDSPVFLLWSCSCNSDMAKFTTNDGEPKNVRRKPRTGQASQATLGRVMFSPTGFL